MLTLIATVGVLILGSVFSDATAALVCRRLPGFSYDATISLLIGLLVVTAFALGLVVMYLLLKL